MKPENVTCPDCDGPMVSRKSSYGVFWGCADYPKCKGTRNADGEARRKVLYDGNDKDGVSDAPDLMPSDRQRQNDKRRW